MTEAQRFPLDFDALHKGSVVSAEEIEAIVRVSRDSARYSARQTDLCFRIERELRDRGIDATVATIKDEIHVLDDPAAAIHNRQLFDKGMKRLRRAHRKLMQVDTGQLSDEERKQYVRTLTVQGAVLVGAMSAQRKAIVIAYARKTPGLPKPEGAAE